MAPEEKKETAIYIGPAGWSYGDWEGIAYPSGKGYDKLLCVARYFNVIELNSSFYRLPSERMVVSWRDRLSSVAGFRLAIKVNGKFTHERQYVAGELKGFVDRFHPLHEAGISGPFLLQFPWSFRNSPETREYLERLAPFFEGRPAAVELRHGSWDDPATLELLADNDFAFCNIDQPLIGDSLRPSAHLTNPDTGYIRLHGRNAKDWFRKDAGRDARYDYLYSHEEMEGWSLRAAGMIGRVGSLFIIMNNHFRGQALANALQLRSMLVGGEIEAPASLIRSFGLLSDIASPPPGEEELGLWDC
jgi:uncharacterized protein YecE (DUF72 family)